MRFVVAALSLGAWVVFHFVIYSARVWQSEESFSWSAFAVEVGLVLGFGVGSFVIMTALGLAVMGPIFLIHKARLRSKE